MVNTTSFLVLIYPKYDSVLVIIRTQLDDEPLNQESHLGRTSRHTTCGTKTRVYINIFIILNGRGSMERYTYFSVDQSTCASFGWFEHELQRIPVFIARGRVCYIWKDTMAWYEIWIIYIMNLAIIYFLLRSRVYVGTFVLFGSSLYLSRSQPF